MPHFGDDLEIRRHERILLRPWLENLIDSGKVPGLQWFDNTRTLFHVPWKHQSRKTWSLGHSSVFLEWAKNTGRWKEGDPEPHYAQLKTRLRCAFSKAPDIEEMKDLHCSKADEPYKVYRFVPKKESKLFPFGRRSIARKSIHNHMSLKRCPLVTSNVRHEGVATNFDEQLSCRKTLNEGLPLNSSNELSTYHVNYTQPVMEPASDCFNETPFHIKEFQEQLEMANTSDVMMQDNAVDEPKSCVYPNNQPIIELISMPGIPGMDFAATSNEPTEVQEYCRGMRRTILPHVEGGVNLCAGSKGSCAEQMNSTSADISSMSADLPPNANRTEKLTRVDSVKVCFNLSDLPEMSVSEKVRSWNLTGSTNSAESRECDRVLPSSADVSSIKVIEKLRNDCVENSNKTAPNFGSLLPCKQQNWPPRATEDVGNHCTVKPREKLVLPEKCGEHSRPNVAVTLPIFPLKNRYNISKNYPDKERLNLSSGNQSAVPISDGNLGLFTNSGEHIQWERESDAIDQNETVRSSGQDLFPGIRDERSLVKDCLNFQCGSFPGMFDKRSRNFQRFCEVSGDLHQNSDRRDDQVSLRPEVLPTKNHRVNGFMEEERVFHRSCDRYTGYGNGPMMETESNRNWCEHDDRRDSNVVVAGEEPNQREPHAETFHYNDVRPFASDRKGNWETYDSALDATQLMLQSSDVSLGQGRVLHMSDADGRGAQRDIFTREVPLDLSNKADLFVQYARIDGGRVGSFQDHVQSYHVQTVRPSDKPSDSYNCRNDFQRMDPGLALGSVEAEEFQLKKYDLSSNMCLGRLKAAYKKLVLRTMFVAEKERELDDVEKRLIAREKSVLQKEDKLQKLLWDFAETRCEGEMENRSGGIKLLPLIDSRRDENCREACQSGAVPPPQTLPAEPGCFRAEKDTPMEVSYVEGYAPSWKPVELPEDAPLPYFAPGRLDCREEYLDSLRTTAPSDQYTNDVHYSYQPIYESLPCGTSNAQSALVNRAYIGESNDAQSSGVLIPGPVNSPFSSTPGPLASHGVPYNRSNGWELVDTRVNRADHQPRGVSSEKILPENTRMSNISLKSFLSRNSNETCDKSLGNRPTEIPSHKSAERDRAPWGSRSTSALPEGENITRILPPVSSGVFGVIK